MLKEIDAVCDGDDDDQLKKSHAEPCTSMCCPLSHSVAHVSEDEDIDSRGVKCRIINCLFLHYVAVILSEGDSCMISIGVVPRHYQHDRQPGWNPGSVAYHADDGGYGFVYKQMTNFK